MKKSSHLVFRVSILVNWKRQARWNDGSTWQLTPHDWPSSVASWRPYQTNKCDGLIYDTNYEYATIIQRFLSVSRHAKLVAGNLGRDVRCERRWRLARYHLSGACSLRCGARLAGHPLRPRGADSDGFRHMDHWSLGYPATQKAKAKPHQTAEPGWRSMSSRISSLSVCDTYNPSIDRSITMQIIRASIIVCYKPTIYLCGR